MNELIERARVAAEVAHSTTECDVPATCPVCAAIAAIKALANALASARSELEQRESENEGLLALARSQCTFDHGCVWCQARIEAFGALSPETKQKLNNHEMGTLAKVRTE